ncbi:Seven TM Receptor [Caenorhabditis elegans]|uniref:Seven TM Receptor n=1 Tax=Caenorhabditis elegans TaxID=6239 RepID=P91860_CAEEL|nr:Seven TM Receptor [Caenorhabditis elegans]CAB05504.1 Seven TM Receptor [Caenorhabditis elegans]|eukprot:NP_493595.1 Seven TM Receptor [Caenorhabditis elegans]
MFPYYHIVERVIGIFGIIINATLIYLIAKKTVTKLGNYRFLMMHISLFELGFSVLHGITVPIMYTSECMNFLVLRVDKSLLPKPLLELLAVIFCNMFGMSISLFATQFIYRYLVLSRNKMLRHHDGRTIVYMILFNLLFGAVWGVLAWFTMSPFPEADQILSENFALPNGLSIEQVAYVGFIFYISDETSNNLRVHWESVIGIGIQCVFISISFCLIFIFGFKCYRQTRKFVSSQSTNAINLNSQLFNALVLQTIIPICLMHFPATIVYMAAGLNKSNEIFGQLLSLFICLYPVLDPLPNFFIIKSYQKVVKDFYSKILRRQPPSTIVRPGSNRTLAFPNASSIVHLT